jgi:hypothetical protein
LIGVASRSALGNGHREGLGAVNVTDEGEQGARTVAQGPDERAAIRATGTASDGEDESRAGLVERFPTSSTW